MRQYSSETDYPIILEACRAAGEIAIAPVARALSQLRDRAGGEVRTAMDEQTARNNRATALVLASIVAVFFVGIIVKYLLLK